MLKKRRFPITKTEVTWANGANDVLALPIKDTMCGRLPFYAFLAKNLGIPISSISVETIVFTASVVMAPAFIWKKAQEYILEKINKRTACFIIKRGNTWKIISSDKWEEGADVGMYALGTLNPEKALSGCESVHSRFSGFFGNLEAFNPKKFNVRFIDDDKQRKLLGNIPKESVWDGLILLNRSTYMSELGMEEAPKPGTVVKAFRYAIQGKGILKGNAVLWDLPKNVDIVTSKMNLKNEWLPSFHAICWAGTHDHSLPAFTDRQMITMFEPAMTRVLPSYTNRFFNEVIGACDEIQHLKELVFKYTTDEKDGGDEEITADSGVLDIIRILRNPLREPALRNRVYNMLMHGKNGHNRFTEGRIPIPAEYGENVYILPDLTALNRYFYFDPKKAKLGAGFAFCSNKNCEAVLIRSPHSNPNEKWFTSLCDTKGFESFSDGILFINVFDASGVLKTLGGADYDDMVKVLTDPVVVEHMGKDTFRCDEADEGIITSFTDTKPMCSVDPSWGDNLLFLADGMRDGMADIGVWAATVCRLLPGYRYLQRILKDARPTTYEQFFNIVQNADTHLRMAVPSDNSASYKDRFRYLKVAEVTIKTGKDKNGNVLKDPLAHVLWYMYVHMPAYMIMLAPFFGEEYIDFCNGKHKGYHDIRGLFNHCHDKLAHFPSDRYCFTNFDCNFPFGLSDAFEGTFYMVPTGNTGPFFSYQNALLYGCWHKNAKGGPIQPKQLELNGRTGPENWMYALMKKAFGNGWFMCDSTSGSARKSTQWIKEHWSPLVEKWKESGEAEMRVVAAHQVIEGLFPDAGKYKASLGWFTKYAGQQWLKPAYLAMSESKGGEFAGERLAVLLGVQNIATIKSRELKSKINSVGGEIHRLAVPEQMIPDAKMVENTTQWMVAKAYNYAADTWWKQNRYAIPVEGHEILTKAAQSQGYTDLKHYMLSNKYEVIDDSLCWIDLEGVTGELIQKYGESREKEEADS